jgi:F0F1-type ATP synthase membrane subunit b/b'
MGFLDTIVDAVWKRLKPEIDEMQATAKTELDEWQVIAEQQLDEWRTEAMAMLKEALPEMAGAIAEQAVKTVFEHTQVDEAADAVSGVITDIVGRLGFGLR